MLPHIRHKPIVQSSLPPFLMFYMLLTVMCVILQNTFYSKILYPVIINRLFWTLKWEHKYTVTTKLVKKKWKDEEASGKRQQPVH